MAGDSRLGSGAFALARLLPSISLPLTVTLAVGAVAQAVAMPVTTVVIGRLLGALADAVGDGFSSPAGSRFLTLLVALAVLMLVTYLVGQVVTVAGGMLSHRVDGTLRARVMRSLMGPPRLDHLHEDDLQGTLAIARDLSPTGFTPGAAAAALAPAIAVRAGSLLEAGVLVVLGLWELAIGLLVLRLLSEVLLLRVFFDNVSGITESGVDLRRVVYLRDLGTTAPGAKELRIFGLGDWLAARHRLAFYTLMRDVWSSRQANRSRVAALAGLAGATRILGAVVVISAAFDGRLDFAGFVIAFGAAQGVSSLSAGNHELLVAYGATSVPAVLRLEELLSAPRFSTSGARPATDLPAEMIRFEHVTFSYPSSSQPVFDGLTLEIPVGQRLAIVGLNGAGKTTLVKLLCGLHEPNSGRIIIDGADLAELDPASWRRRVAVLFQDFLRYQLPARDNIRLGAVGVPVDDELLDALAARVGAGDVIARLEAGWDTPLGASLTGGTDLSGGEWQRLALARALLAVQAGARILVLDEPTANLDVRAEAEIYNRFLELTASGPDGVPLTSIVISHRFSTVRRADRIIVLEAGRVIEDGDHHDLVARRGRYAALFEAQAARFADAPDEEEPIDA